MAQKVKTAMPDDLHLGGGYVIEWDAVDPVTGDSVPGVVVSDTSLGVASLGAGPGGGDGLVGPFMLVPGPAA
jgi:hypothetical protein